MSVKSKERQKFQSDFLESGKEISVGNIENFPMSIEQLCSTQKDSPWVRKCFSGGLTAEVFKIECDGKFYTLKKKRSRILVSNIDGQTSFLNEVQRRRDFEILKNKYPDLYRGVVDTIYASLNNGIILSPWIEGEHVRRYNSEIFDSIFFTLISIELGGIFEYDPTSGNFILTEDGKIVMYDFGYAYPFDPRLEYNADGCEDPLFHCAERFETRCLMQHLMDVEDFAGRDRSMELFRMEKIAAVSAYKRKLEWLRSNNSSKNIIEYVSSFISTWESALSASGELEKLYSLESFRSYVLDVHDDLGGKSCTPDTLRKIDRIIRILKNDFSFLKEHNGFFWGDELLTNGELVAKYSKCREDAVRWQISSFCADDWIKSRRREIARDYL